MGKKNVERVVRKAAVVKEPAGSAAGRMNKIHLPLFALALVIVFMRFWNLEGIPGGAYVDETSIGYNARCVLITGADEHGVRLPLDFKAFGEYKNPIFIYSLVPLIRLFGASVWVLRLGACIFGLGCVIFIGLIAWHSLGRYSWAIFTFLLAGTMPWLFTLSRVAFEAVSFPFFIAAAWWSWLRATKQDSDRWFLISSAAWGISLFAYSTARLLVPLLFIALISCYLKMLRERPVRFLAALLPFLLCVALLISWSLRNPGTLTARFEYLSIMKDNADPLAVAFRFLSNYLSYLSPLFLFVRGDPNLRHHTAQGGELFLFTFPALLMGLWYAWQNRQKALELFTLLGFLLFPVAASLTRDEHHALRTINAVPFAILLIVWGFRELADWARNKRLLVGLFAVIALIETTTFYYDYFARYQERAQAYFCAGLPQALKTAFASKQGPLFYSPLAFRDEDFAVREPYIQLLFFGKLDPAAFRAKGLAGFGIYPYQKGTVLPAGSVLILKDGDNLYTASHRTLLSKNPDPAPQKSTLIEEITVSISSDGAAPDSLASHYRVYRIP